MIIRKVEERDRTHWLQLRLELWPGNEAEHLDDINRYFSTNRREPLMVLVAENETGELVGFAELSIRLYAEGCMTDNVGYLEGWFVSPSARGLGIGRALIQASETWALEQGCSEFASDTEWDNVPSAKAHNACGFEEAGVVRCFRKTISHASQNSGVRSQNSGVRSQNSGVRSQESGVRSQNETPKTFEESR